MLAPNRNLGLVMRFTEDQFSKWSGAPSKSETDKMTNAENAVRKAISASDALAKRNIKVFAQGSYRNRVNVRAESDVDIAVLCTNSFIWDGPNGATLDSLGYKPATYLYPQFRKEVGAALRSYFNSGVVTEGDKAFDISANTYRVEADVAPFFSYKYFYEGGGHRNGVAMYPKSGGKLYNYPDQHYDNGVAKNSDTGRGFKGCVRILKTVRCMMIADGYKSAEKAPSFLIECLTYNIPNEYLLRDGWLAKVRASLAFLFNNTRSDADCDWFEVNGYKYLFRSTQPWTREGAHQFISDCWDYIGFE